MLKMLRNRTTSESKQTIMITDAEVTRMRITVRQQW